MIVLQSVPIFTLLKHKSIHVREKQNVSYCLYIKVVWSPYQNKWKKHEKNQINQTFCIMWKLLRQFKKPYGFYFHLNPQSNTILVLLLYTHTHTRTYLAALQQSSKVTMNTDDDQQVAPLSRFRPSTNCLHYRS